MAQLALLQLMRGIRSHRYHPLLLSHAEKMVMVSLPLLFIFPPPFKLFLTESFCIKLLFNWLHQLPSLGQQRDQGQAATLTHDSPTEGDGCEFLSVVNC